MSATVTAIPVDQHSEYYNLVQLEVNDEGNVRVNWHPDLAGDAKAMYKALQMLIMAAAELSQGTEAAN